MISIFQRFTGVLLSAVLFALISLTRGVNFGFSELSFYDAFFFLTEGDSVSFDFTYILVLIFFTFHFFNGSRFIFLGLPGGFYDSATSLDGHQKTTMLVLTGSVAAAPVIFLFLLLV